jgi:superfamily II DNA/RNA helicase
MELLTQLKDGLLTSAPQWVTLRQAATYTRNHKPDSDPLITAIIERLAHCLHLRHYTDALPHLRQLIRLTGELTVFAALWAALSPKAEAFGLQATPDGGRVIVSAEAWQPYWLGASEGTDALLPRSTHPPSLADGILNAMRPDWTHYRSEAQKAAVDAWLFAPAGSTTLVTLPTGGGKSLCILLPAWLESRGGRENNGTTLVVVPTVALALDQEQQAVKFFGGKMKPLSRTGQNTARERHEILYQLENGSLPVLYTSPESLLGTMLKETCLEAVRHGLITRFVIDEAHLSETWGATFRTEFQLLAAFQKEMLQASNGALRTLLLSATVSENGYQHLVELFAPHGNLITVQANRLRPEMNYWFSKTTERDRQERVLEALRHLPRPAILYVTRPDQAQWWLHVLREEGYQRVEAFTGETTSTDRQDLLERWGKNLIDIMVGTSAFGLGVDKSDVRTVIHATLPENADRYYQEVGRAGRDGYSATALLCMTYEDIDLAYGLSPKRITVEKAYPRWRTMIDTARPTDVGDTNLLNRDSKPQGNYNDPVEKDRDWNDHLLLLLQRAGVIRLEGLVNPNRDEETGIESPPLIKVRFLDFNLRDDYAHFAAVLETIREKELSTDATKVLIDIVNDYGNKSRPPSQCLGARLATLYRDVQITCGGCAACRAAGRPAYGGESLNFRVFYPRVLSNQVVAAPIHPDLRRKLGGYKALIVTWGGPRTPAGLQAAVDLLPLLAKNGFQQFVLPDGLYTDRSVGERLVRALAQVDERLVLYPHRVIPLSWVLNEYRTPLLPLPSVVLYPPEDREAERVHKAIVAAKLPACIYVVHDQLRLGPTGKVFCDTVNGLNETTSRFFSQLQGLPPFDE